MRKLISLLLLLFPLLTYAKVFTSTEFNSTDLNFDILETKFVDLDDGRGHVCECIMCDLRCSIITQKELYDTDKTFYVFIQKTHPTIHRIIAGHFLYSIDYAHLFLDAMRTQYGWKWYNSKMKEVDGYNEDPIERTVGGDIMYVSRRYPEIKTSVEELPMFINWIH